MPFICSAGGKHNTLKALYFDKTGFVLMQKRLDQGRFQWPQDPSQARELTRQELRWLLEGLSINQPKALKPSGEKGFLTRASCLCAIWRI